MLEALSNANTVVGTLLLDADTGELAADCITEAPVPSDGTWGNPFSAAVGTVYKLRFELNLDFRQLVVYADLEASSYGANPVARCATDDLPISANATGFRLRGGDAGVRYAVDEIAAYAKPSSMETETGSSDDILEHWAEKFVPFNPRSAIDAENPNCSSAPADTRYLGAALELHRRGSASPFAISPDIAEPYVRYLAETMTIHVGGPSPDDGPCHDLTTGGGPIQSGQMALLGHLLSRYGENWDGRTMEAIRRYRDDANWLHETSRGLYIYNKWTPYPTFDLRFGAAACDAPTWERGWKRAEAMFNNLVNHGGFETNSPHYSYHTTTDLILWNELPDSTPREMGRFMLDWELLAIGHQYQPGGSGGQIQTRDPNGIVTPGRVREKSLGPLVSEQITGNDFQFYGRHDGGQFRYYDNSSSWPHSNLVTAHLVDWKVPSLIRSIYLEKDEGYDFWMLHAPSAGAGRLPHAYYNLGQPVDSGAHAWQVHMLPGGAAALAAAYGAWNPVDSNRGATTIACDACPQKFALINQFQPCVDGDTEDTGAVKCTSERPALENGSELYDYEHFIHHRTRLSLWDPRPRPSRWDPADVSVRRGAPWTHALIQNFSSVGGEEGFPTNPADWYFGRLGDVFIAYRPFAEKSGGGAQGVTLVDRAWRNDWSTSPIPVELRPTFTALKLNGRSGGIIVLAMEGEVGALTFADFQADIESRYSAFDPAGANNLPTLEFDARDQSGDLVRMRLEYLGEPGAGVASSGLEKRYLDVELDGFEADDELDLDTFFARVTGGSLMDSPWVDYDAVGKLMTLSRPTYPTRVYDVGAIQLAAQTIAPPPECGSRAYLRTPASLSHEVVRGSASAELAFGVENSGYASATVEVIVERIDDCGGDAAITTWLTAPANVVIPARAGPVVVAIDTAPASNCQPGSHHATLLLRSLEGNVADHRIEVMLEVGPAAP